jgi:hypothetical protein
MNIIDTIKQKLISPIRSYTYGCVEGSKGKAAERREHRIDDFIFTVLSIGETVTHVNFNFIEYLNL